VKGVEGNGVAKVDFFDEGERFIEGGVFFDFGEVFVEEGIFVGSREPLGCFY
jgi:hypothetical protein